MRNQRSNFIPVPTRPAKNTPKPLPRVLAQRKSSSSQTERVVLVKEENLTFYPCTRFGQNDGGMRRDYVKAVNYINSCHKFINTIIEKNNSGGKTNIFLLPMVANFIPIFPYLIGKRPQKPKERHDEKRSNDTKTSRNKSEERKAKSNFAVKKVLPPEEIPIDPVSVGDCGKNLSLIQEDPYEKLAGIVKDQIQQFLNTLQEDIDKATRKMKNEPPKQKCRNLDIVKQRLEELTKICFLQRNIEKNPTVVQNVTIPSPPPFRETSEDCSIILSDTDFTETKTKLIPESVKIASYGDSSGSSLVSDSSDIKSDSDLEINNT